MDDRRVASYTSADAVPVKLFYHADAVGQFKPLHAQWIPTNRCNLRCPCCSCENRETSQEMDQGTALDVIDSLAERGCRAVTITGGGEPLLHPGIAEMIERFAAHGIDVGLVTNGTAFRRVTRETLDLLTWCRISSMDYRMFTPRYRKELEWAVQANVDWAFSHVVGTQPNLETIAALVQFAEQHRFTHVRLVGDLLCPEEIDFDPVYSTLGERSIVIYQPRKNPVECHHCMIGYVKPLITPDFRVYHCCGVQYALEPPSLNFPDALCMGSALDLGAIYHAPQPYRVPCVRCYYRAYNDTLIAVYNGHPLPGLPLEAVPDHVNFI